MTQSNLFPEPEKVVNWQAPEVAALPTEKNCEHCEKLMPIPRGVVNKRFCSEYCKKANKRKLEKDMRATNTEPIDNDLNDDDENEVMNHKPSSRVRKPKAPGDASLAPLAKPRREITLSGVDTPTALVIELYKREAERATEAYNQQLAKNEKLITERDTLKELIRETEHKAKLNGLEVIKPDFIDRLGALPPQILDGLTPIMHKLASFIPGSSNSGGVAGASDITADQMAVLEWISKLPSNDQEIFIGIVSSLMGMQDTVARSAALTQIFNVLRTGTTIPGSGRDNRMYATN